MPCSRMNFNLPLPLVVPLHMCACVRTHTHISQNFYRGVILKFHMAGNATHGITARQVRSSKYRSTEGTDGAAAAD